MAMTEQERRQVWRGLMRLWSSLPDGERPETNFKKEDLFDAVVAADQKCDDWTAEYNQALPQPFREEATQEQKTLVLMGVMARRQGVGFCRRVFGEVD